ncbi:sugar (and other) transporter family protein [Corynebacterium deserti GIMN1.010]|uniref:Putative proline/betaine transporter n=1 Tax=Corynebacterium deserti GIMN1.010 TaxID=931089 RepID=A0A0M4CMG2_9CORY|nr:MFS transporter [Corynebacterium deserti]ALC04530.1 sugar (and other) transporter family protein [Corynebacterium deserti GIMN1.010]
MSSTQTSTQATEKPASSGLEGVGKKDLYKAFAASLSGTSLEWYDFAVYSAASALVLGQLFFPAGDPYVATIAAFSTYAVGYISRPLGGIFFGRLGDKVGRKKVLVYTLLLIGIATFIIGLLPTYDQVGILAPILLVTLRFAQGVGVGGEWGGAVLLSSEFGDPKKRGFWASAAQVGPPLGNLMANGMLALLTVTLTSEQFLSWGWRVAFLVSLLLVAFGLWIRLKLEDTPVFQALQESGDRSEKPVTEVFTTQRRQLLSAVLSRLGPDVFYALYTVFILTYGVQKLELERSTVLAAVLIGSATQLVTIPLAGWMSDFINRRLLYGIGAVAAGIWAYVMFGLMDPSNFWTIALSMVVAGTCHSFMFGPQAAFVIEQFEPRLRYTGSSLAYTIGGVFGGAIAPLMFTLVAGPEINFLPVAIYVTAACALTLVGLSLGRNSVPEEDLEYIQKLQGNRIHM